MQASCSMPLVFISKTIVGTDSIHLCMYAQLLVLVCDASSTCQLHVCYVAPLPRHGLHLAVLLVAFGICKTLLALTTGVMSTQHKARWGSTACPDMMSLLLV